MTTKTGQSLLIRPFSAKVTLIPSFVDGKFTGRPYKAEQNLYRTSASGARLHVWFEPDPRPHNHPWLWIDCQVLRGGYRATEYLQLADGSYDSALACEIRLGSGSLPHRLSHSTCHQVVEVQPGTISLMTFGPLVTDAQNWGNLVFADPGAAESKGVIDKNTNQPGFLDALRHLNPHMRPDHWADPYADMPVPTIDELMTQHPAWQ